MTPREALTYALEYLGRDDITGVMVAYKEKDGKLTSEVSIQFHVKEKLAISQIPETKVLPDNIKGTPTDVVVRRVKPTDSINQGPATVLQGGLSIGPEYVNTGSGTLGYLITDKDTDKLVGLTNLHVVACAGTPMVPYGYMLQPSINDGGTEVTDRIGYTDKWALSEWYDVATLTLMNREAVPQIATTKQVILDYRDPEIGDTVTKVGRSTAVTTATITGYGYVAVDYSSWGYSDSLSCWVMAFADVADSSQVLAAGDSGALLYCPTDGCALGLVCAEDSESGLMGYASYLSYIIEDFNLEIPAVTVNSKEVAVAASIGTKHQSDVVLSLHAMGTGTILGTKVTAINDNPTIYTTLDEYAVSLGYADAAALLLDKDFDTEADYAASFGYDSVEDFLSAVSVPSLVDLLASAGVTFTDE